MPELPEVETVRRGLSPHLKGARIARVTCMRKDLRFPLPAAFSKRLAGAKIVKIDRRAKYLLFHLSNNLVILSHLGMTGRFRIEGGKAAHSPGAFYDDTLASMRHDHVVIELNRQKRLVYNDARRFGFMELFKFEELGKRFAAIGIEPLSKAFTGITLHKLLEGKKAPVKAALLDQSLIAGIGNIYACEALYRAKISPCKPAKRLNAQQCTSLARAIKDVLKKAIRYGGSTLRDFHDENGASGAFQDEFKVYDRQDRPCPRCKTLIKRMIQSGRSSFYCSTCQR
jgi:formamidopyrimidine-DNA glycosylase